MPIGGASGIGWDENSPPQTEGAGSGFARLQSIKTSIRQGLDAEHSWPSAGGDNVGYHRFGSVRHFYGTQSQVSSSGSDGRTLLTSDTSRLFGVGSGGTVYLGGAYGLSLGSMVGLTWPQRAQIVEDIGYGVTSSSGTTTLTFPGSGYSGVPFVSVTLMNFAISQLSANYILSVQTRDGASCDIWATAGNGNMAAGVPFLWRSLGTRAL